MPPARKSSAPKPTVSKTKWSGKPIMKLNAPRNQPQISYCTPNQEVSKPRPKERLQMPTPSPPTAPTHQGPTYNQLANEVNMLRAAIKELHRGLEGNRVTITNQNATICAMDRTIKGLTANFRPVPCTKVQFHGSRGLQPVPQQPTPKVSPDSHLALFNEDYDFSAADYGANTLVAPAAPPMSGNAQSHPYAHPYTASFGVSSQHNSLSAPTNLTANDDTFEDYSMAVAPQPYTFPTANAPVATQSEPALLPFTNGKLVADASVLPLPLKAADKPAEPVVTTIAAAPAQQQERQATPAAEPLETQMTDWIKEFLHQDMLE